MNNLPNVYPEGVMIPTQSFLLNLIEGPVSKVLDYTNISDVQCSKRPSRHGRTKDTYEELLSHMGKLSILIISVLKSQPSQIFNIYISTIDHFSL